MSQLLQGFAQLEEQIDLDEDRYTQSQQEEIDARLDRIRAAIQNDQVVRNRYTGLPGALVGAQDCVDWSRSDVGWYGRSQFYLWCTDWEYQVTGQIGLLRDYLTSIGSHDAAEVADALEVTSERQTEHAEEVVPDSGDLWESTPTWVKWAVPLGLAAYFVFALETTKAYVRK